MAEPTSTPSTTPETTVAKVEGAAKAAKADVMKEYVVVSDMIAYRTGQGKAEVRRFLRHARLILDSTDERTIALVKSKGIALRRGDKELARTTPRVAAAAQGSAGDPALPPAEAVQPILPTEAAPVNPNA